MTEVRPSYPTVIEEIEQQMLRNKIQLEYEKGYEEGFILTGQQVALDWVALAPTPFQAMKAGRALRKGKDLRNNWDDLKLDYMLTGLRAKFSDEHLRTRMLETGDAVLHEDSPTDMFWGKKGKDWLGRLLMRVRDEICSSNTSVRKEE